LSHLNPQASPEAQALFDTLVKACHGVEWNGMNILVLKEVIVSEPYRARDCKGRLVKDQEQDKIMLKNSLERVRKIVQRFWDGREKK